MDLDVADPLESPEGPGSGVPGNRKPITRGAVSRRCSTVSVTIKRPVTDDGDPVGDALDLGERMG